MTENSPAAWDNRADAPTPAAAGLQSEKGQTLRFLAVLRHLDLRVGDTLLDFACGAGRLAYWLPYGVEYFAHDWSPKLLDRAMLEHPGAHRVDELTDQVFDHVVAVGPFNLAGNWSREQTWETVADLWARTYSMLAVSVLRGTGTNQDVLVYTPAELAEAAATLGVKRFVVDGSYLDNDLLLVLRR
jgi:cyclopropane fatty-acyl-phospholipid synthase-like methyltransferase